MDSFSGIGELVSAFTTDLLSVIFEFLESLFSALSAGFGGILDE